MDLLAGHEVLVGTYEEYVLGYAPSPASSDFKTTFTDHAHSGSLKAVAAAGKFLITSGADENVKIFNLRNRTEHGGLHHSDAAVNILAFYDERHVVTAGEDNKIYILKTNTWQVEKTLTKHTDAVLDVCIHPSGKMALSVGRDKKLVTWNLIKGRSAYVTNLHETADFVRWSEDGTHYAVGLNRRVDVYSVASAAVVHSVPLKGRSNAVAFLDDDVFCLAGEMAEVEIHSIGEKKLLHKFEAHERRVRCLQLILDNSEAGKGKKFCLVTASNDGFIKAWKLERKGSKIDASLAASQDTKCRITCMTVHKVPEVKHSAPKRPPQADAAEVTLKKKKKKSAVTPQSPSKGDSKAKEKVVVQVEEERSPAKSKRKKKQKKMAAA